MQFEWDRHKAVQNAANHGVSFDEAAAIADTSDSDMPDEVRITRGVRGKYLPAAEPERSKALLARLRTMQETAARLYDENVRLRILLSWEAGQLSEHEAAQRLGTDPAALAGLRAQALGASTEPAA
jgi:uncharacterized DUF497 family protein